MVLNNNLKVVSKNLIAAVKSNNIDSVANILSLKELNIVKLNFDVLDNEGTALMWAVYKKNAIIVNLLIESGVNVNYQNIHKRSCINISIYLYTNG